MITKLQNEIKEAMKNKNVVQRDCLKMVLNKAREIAKEAKEEDVSDEMVASAAKKELKQLQQTVDALKGHEDSTLYKETIEKMKYVGNYVPKQMDESELRVAITSFAEENGLIGKGRAAMKDIMPVFKEKADGKLISQIVAEVCT